ncbi:hypothetical protein P152DRAFT_379187, partial [Eremomyces bilateralis CBS 781.70]
MSASAFGRDLGSWEWLDDTPRPANNDSRHRASGAPGPSSSSPADSGNRAPPEASASPKTNIPPKQRQWKPRTCRICLDTVHPTYHPPSESLPGIFQAGPSVTYDSEEGRLLRPCKCKGSSKYVHENCLQKWRHVDPAYGRRNYWQCPTCGFRYHLQRMSWARIISSAVAQVALTIAILLLAVFLLGFIADPIINLYVDPLGTLSQISRTEPDWHEVEEPFTWTDHFLKGMASLGLLGFLKVFLSSPWNWFNIRVGGGRARGTTGRQRLANLSWIAVMVGIGTVLYAIWRGVRTFSKRTLKKIGERVMDVQGDDDDE